MAFKSVSGQPSFETTPDLAAAEPVITNAGKTYTFTLRKGITFSNGHVLDTADVVASFQRIFKVSSPTAGSFYNGIVGATACLKTPKTCTLAGGISADAAKNTVTINLTAPDPEFLFKIAVPHASITPVGSPTTDVGTKPLPSTGAYMISAYDPTGNGKLVLSRNPHFTQWSALAQPEGYPDTITESSARASTTRSPRSRTARPTGPRTHRPPDGSTSSGRSTRPRSTSTPSRRCTTCR